jgi:hypothetical protein
VCHREDMGGRREKWKARKTHLNGTFAESSTRESEIREKESIKERR